MYVCNVEDYRNRLKTLLVLIFKKILVGRILTILNLTHNCYTIIHLLNSKILN